MNRKQKKSELRRRTQEHPPQKIQDIPMLFTDLRLPVIRAVILSLFIAKDFDLIPSQSPLRTIWYAFVKRVIEENGKPSADPAGTFYNAGSDIIYTTDLYYSDFNIENSSILFTINPSKGFGNTMLCLEKESYFGVFRNFGKLCGITIYSGGGNPSLSGAEYLYKQLPVKQNLQILTITDYDPAGLDIAYTFKKQFNHYAKRLDHGVTFKIVGVDPTYYTPNEIDISKYKCSATNRKRWNLNRFKRQRDDIGISQKEGFEVESMPADPTDVFHLIFPNFDLHGWIGHARMRLIVLKNLIELNGIENYLTYWIESCFTIEKSAQTIVYDKYTISENLGVTNKLKRKIVEIEEIIENCVKNEKKEIEQEITEHKNDFIEQALSHESYKHIFQQTMIDAVARNDDSLEKDEMEIPSEISENLEIIESKKTTIEILRRKLVRILDDLDSAKKEFESGETQEKDDIIFEKVYCESCGKQTGWKLGMGKEKVIKHFGDFQNEQENWAYYTLDKVLCKNYDIEYCKPSCLRRN